MSFSWLVSFFPFLQFDEYNYYYYYYFSPRFLTELRHLCISKSIQYKYEWPHGPQETSTSLVAYNPAIRIFCRLLNVSFSYFACQNMQMWLRWKPSDEWKPCPTLTWLSHHLPFSSQVLFLDNLLGGALLSEEASRQLRVVKWRSRAALGASGGYTRMPKVQGHSTSVHWVIWKWRLITSKRTHCYNGRRKHPGLEFYRLKAKSKYRISQAP